jgi:hypothetical protein
MRYGADAMDWSKDRRDANSDYDNQRKFFDEKERKLNEAGKQFQCDTYVLVCYRINIRGKSTPIPGTVVIYKGTVMYPAGTGVRCELQLARGRNNNSCCSN